jgi:hypothetical protein
LILSAFNHQSTDKDCPVSIVCLTNLGSIVAVDNIPVESIVRATVSSPHASAAVQKALASVKPRRNAVRRSDNGVDDQKTFCFNKAAVSGSKLFALDQNTRSLYYLDYSENSEEGPFELSTNCLDFCINNYQSLSFCCVLYTGSSGLDDRPTVNISYSEIRGAGVELIAETSISDTNDGFIIAGANNAVGMGCSDSSGPAVFTSSFLIGHKRSFFQGDHATLSTILLKCVPRSGRTDVSLIGEATTVFSAQDVKHFSSVGLVALEGNACLGSVGVVMNWESKSDPAVVAITLSYQLSALLVSILCGTAVCSDFEDRTESYADDASDLLAPYLSQNVNAFKCVTISDLSSTIICGVVAGILDEMPSTDGRLLNFIGSLAQQFINGTAKIASDGGVLPLIPTAPDAVLLLALLLETTTEITHAVQSFMGAITRAKDQHIRLTGILVTKLDYVEHIMLCIGLANQLKDWEVVRPRNSCLVASRLRWLLSDIFFERSFDLCLERGNLSSAARLFMANRSASLSRLELITPSGCIRRLKVVIPADVAVYELHAFINDVCLHVLSNVAESTTVRSSKFALAAELCKRSVAIADKCYLNHYSALYLVELACNIVGCSTPAAAWTVSNVSSVKPDESNLSPVTRVQNLYRQMRTLCCLRSVYFTASSTGATDTKATSSSLSDVITKGLNGILFARLWSIGALVCEPAVTDGSIRAEAIQSFTREINSFTIPALSYFEMEVDSLLKNWITASISERVVGLERIRLTTDKTIEGFPVADEDDMIVSLWKLVVATTQIQSIPLKAEMLLLLLQLPALAECRSWFGDTARQMRSAAHNIEDAMDCAGMLCTCSRDCLPNVDDSLREKLTEALRLQRIRC